MTYGGPAHAEERSDEPAHDARGRRPPPAQSPPGFTTEHQVDGVGAHEQAERQQGRVARQAEEQRDAQGEPEEREGHERHELSSVGLEHEGQGEEVDENGNRDRRGAEPRDAEYEVRDEDHEDHEGHEQQHVVRGRHAGTAGHY